MHTYRKRSLQSITNIINQYFLDNDTVGFPSPYLSDLIPDSNFPNTTSNFQLLGSYFLPTDTIQIDDVVVNYQVFQSDNEITLNGTSNAVESYKNVTITRDGTDYVFEDVLLIIYGTVFTPLQADYNLTSGNCDLSNSGQILVADLITDNLLDIKQASFVTPVSGDWIILFTFSLSQHGYPNTPLWADVDYLKLKRVSDDVEVVKVSLRHTTGENTDAQIQGSILGSADTTANYIPSEYLVPYKITSVGGSITIYVNNVIFKSYNAANFNELYVDLLLQDVDLINFKMIDTTA